MQQAIGKLDVEGVLESQHHIDAGVRGETGSIKIIIAEDSLRVYRKLRVLTKDSSNDRFIRHNVPFVSARLVSMKTVA